jgi:ADP-heptose:LPS heptosyltransferase
MVDYKNIFVFHPAGLGDAILDLSTLDQLFNASNYTGQIHYVGNIVAKPIIDLSGLPIGIKKHYIKYPFDIKSIIKLLSLRNKIDCLAILGGMNLKKVSYLKYLLNPRIMIGSLTDDPIECINKNLPKNNIYDHIEGPHEGSHRIQLNLMLFRKIGINAPLSIKGLDKNLVNKIPLVYDDIINTSEEYFTIHISNNKKFKTLPQDLWIGIIRILIEKYDIPIVIIGEKNEADYSSIILESIASNKIINLIGKTDLLQTIKIINDSNLLLSIDSGLGHIAGALDVPLISIFGPTKISQISPISNFGYSIHYPLECSNCYWSRNYYNCENNRECLSIISIDSINKAIDLIYNRKKPNYMNYKGTIVKKMITKDGLTSSMKNFMN